MASKELKGEHLQNDYRTRGRATSLSFALPLVIGMMTYMSPSFHGQQKAADAGKAPDAFSAGTLSWGTAEWPVLTRFAVVALLAGLCCAVHLSFKSPRPCHTKRWLDVAVQVLMFAGDMLLLPYYFLFPQVKCDIFFDTSSERNMKLMAATPKLRHFCMTFWLRSAWITLTRMTVRECFRCKFDKEGYLSMVRREVLPLSDGGLVALDWYTAGDALPDSAPILFLSPTLMGDGRSEPTKDVADHFSANGWRCCCFVKRGGGYLESLPLPDWVPTDPLSYDDTVIGLQRVRALYPNSFLAIAGLSAGGGWVRHYLAAAGNDSLADAGMSFDGGWNWWDSVTGVDTDCPFIGKVLGTAMAQPLLKQAAANLEMPSWLDAKRLAAAQTESWSAVMDVAHRRSTGLPLLVDYFANYCDRRDLLEMPQRSSVPLLVLASLGDGCCPTYYWTKLDRVQELPLQCPNTIVCLHATGTHCCRPTGLLGNGSWAAEAALEFFGAVRDEVARVSPSNDTSCKDL